MPRPKKKKVVIVEPIKYEAVRVKLCGAERKSRAEQKEELEHQMAEIVQRACVDQAPVEPMHIVEFKESQARTVQCLYDLVADRCTKVEKRIARVQRSLDSMLVMCEKTPPSSTRGMKMRMKSLQALNDKRVELIRERHRWGLERQSAAGQLREVWTRLEMSLLECY